MKTDLYYVYILLCSNGAYYTGYTTDLERRFNEHVEGTIKCKFTRSFPPLCIAQSWQMTDKNRALKVERFIKKLSKTNKKILIDRPALLSEWLGFALEK